MKKLLAILMALVFVFSFAACGSKDKDDDKKETTTAATSSDKKEPSQTPVEDEKILEPIDFFIEDTEDVLELIDKAGGNISNIENGAFLVEVFDVILTNSSYVCETQVKSGDNTAYIVTVDISIPDVDAAMEIFTGAIEILDAENPDISDEDANELVLETLKQSFADPSVKKVVKSVEVEVASMNGSYQIVDEQLFAQDLFDALFTDFVSAMQAFAQ